jgi:hypothetical protein
MRRLQATDQLADRNLARSIQEQLATGPIEDYRVPSAAIVSLDDPDALRRVLRATQDKDLRKTVKTRIRELKRR